MTAAVPVEEWPCPLCGATGGNEVLRAADPAGVVAGEFRVVRCAACGLSRLNPRPRLDALAACYGEDYAPHRDPAGARPRRLSLADRLVLRHFYGWPFRRPPPGAPAKRSRLARAFLAPLFRRFRQNRKNIRFLPFEGRGRLLDVGCGSGAWLGQHAAGGFDTAGIEVDAAAADRARLYQGQEVHTGTARDAPYHAESFDAVNLSHVLEHVPDPRETMAAIRRFLAPGGLLSISIPVTDGYAATKLGPHWRYLELPRHLLHFDRPRLLSFVAQCGFRIEEVRDDPAGDGWRESFRGAPGPLRGEEWLARLAKRKRYRRRFGARLAREGRSSFVVVHARRDG